MKRLRASRPRSFWGAETRDRIAAQVEQIRHWRVIHGDYTASPDVKATWFVDCPYADKGSHYRCKFSGHDELGSWCRNRQGQVIVCEQDGADWLPFRTFDAGMKSMRGASHEVIWTRDCGLFDRA